MAGYIARSWMCCREARHQNIGSAVCPIPGPCGLCECAVAIQRARISAIEKKRAKHIASVLHDIGFTPELAESWAEIALLVYLGWLDRVTRDLEFQVSGRSLSESLSDLILAASDRSTPAAR